MISCSWLISARLSDLTQDQPLKDLQNLNQQKTDRDPMKADRFFVGIMTPWGF